MTGKQYPSRTEGEKYFNYIKEQLKDGIPELASDLAALSKT